MQQFETDPIVDFQNFSTLQFLEETRRILNNTSNSKSLQFASRSSSNNPVSHVKIKSIARFLIKKLRNKEHSNTQDLIGLLSILCQLIPMLRYQNFSLNLDSKFYRSLKNAVLQTEKKWQKATTETARAESRKLLQVFSTFCIYAQKKEVPHERTVLNWSNILNPQFLQMLCRLSLPTDQKVMKYYRTIILYYLNSNPKNLSDPQIFLSISKHLVTPGQSDSVNLGLLFVMNKLSKDVYKELSANYIIQLFRHLKEKILNLQESQDKFVWALHFAILQRILLETSFASNISYLNLREVLSFVEKLAHMKKIEATIGRSCKEFLLQYLIKMVEISRYCDISVFVSNALQSNSLNKSSTLLSLLVVATKRLRSEDIARLVEQGIVEKFIQKTNRIGVIYENKIVSILNNLLAANKNMEINFILNSIITVYMRHKQQQIVKPTEVHFN